MTQTLVDTIDQTVPATYAEYLMPWRLLSGMAGGGRFARLVDDARNRRLEQLGDPLSEDQWSKLILRLTEHFDSVSDGQAELIRQACQKAHTTEGVDGKTIWATLSAAQVQGALYASGKLEVFLLPQSEWIEAVLADESLLLPAFGNKTDTIMRFIKVVAHSDLTGVTVSPTSTTD
ncbi:hypothetical protein [Pseudomonas sp. P9(2020)]|uniref:hypothetical protein n=1 Tax=Pseudomonas sp. P9(2020) TaxID=2763316 RepID=UPI001B32CB89|nr:hypothetical protein [Pseudomonas sp. P9(2020)]MBP5948072.1 hypothetical protein [Pseudomonas sp. P9(2020)]